MKQKTFDSFQDELSYYRKGGNFKPCYETHPPLPLGDGKVIYGGSCSTPVVKDADIYIGFDYGMKRTPQFPWNAKVEGPVEVYFPIPDMGVPSDLSEFKKMVEWTALQLIAGKKVHAGCIGGHGRTGMFFSALAHHMMGVEDSTSYVRKNYCEKAVESSAQVEYLHKNFGITRVAGAKSPPKSSTKNWGDLGPSQKKVFKSKGFVGSSGSSKKSPALDITSSTKQIHPVDSVRNIWASV